MAMVVQHNIAAQLALGELNKNNDKLRKSLEKVSNGQKINSAKDDASGYVTSEKMREMVRTLNQDHQNVQNGSALFKIADGGINSIVEELRNLKELAINAANDTNTDVDRATIQKEFTQKYANINDIATTTNYNGKPLIDGTYARWHGVETSAPGGGIENTTAKKLIINFSPAYKTEVSMDWISGGGIAVTNSFAPLGRGHEEMPDGYWSWSQEWIKAGHDGTGYTSQVGQFAVNMDFSGMEYTGSLPEALHDQGFVILCGTCSQFINVKFDATTTTSSFNPDYCDRGTVGYDAPCEFTIGVAGVTNTDELEEAVFKGFYSVSDSIINPGWDPTTEDNVLIESDYVHQLRVAKDPHDTSKYLFLKDNSHLQFLTGLMTKDGLAPLPERKDLVEGKPLIIHHGPHANQHTKFFINDMHTEALGIDAARVTTRGAATSAIRVIDKAIDYALDEATQIGSYMQRLDYTDANVVTMGENVQAAESTIRDADMAKEMTDYTKNNVLLQAAQAMLAQANQNGSAVLSLLQ